MPERGQRRVERLELGDRDSAAPAGAGSASPESPTCSRAYSAAAPGARSTPTPSRRSVPTHRSSESAISIGRPAGAERGSWVRISSSRFDDVRRRRRAARRAVAARARQLGVQEQDFETAEALYSAAIDETSSDADGDAACCSRTAPRCVPSWKLDDAIADADSRSRAPTWTRRSIASRRRSGRRATRAAALLSEQAVQLEPSSNSSPSSSSSRRRYANATANNRSRASKIGSPAGHSSRLFSALATFAFFWVSGILHARRSN